MGQVSYSEYIEATPEQVWSVLTDVTRLPDWAYTEGRFPYPVEGHYGSEQKEGPGTVWVGVAADGQKATQEVIVWQPGEKLVYELRGTEHAPLEMTQANTFDLEAVNGGTQITWTLDWELTGGFSLRSLLIRLTGNGAFEEMIAGSLENLKQVVEAEAASRDDQPEEPTQPAAD